MRNKLHERFRILIQCLSFVFHNGYVRGWMNGRIYTGDAKSICVPGLNCYSCPGAFGACPIGSLQAVLDSGQYKFSLYVLGFIGAVGMFCGRFVCGWLCPFGFLQDLLYRIPFVKKVKNLPFHKQLRYLRFVILILFVILLPMLVLNASGVGQPWFCEYICPSGTLLGGYPLTIANDNLRALIGPRFLWKSILLVIILLLSVISFRPFCKYVCPLGALYGLANPISIYRFQVDAESCVQCGSCQQVCGMDIKVWEHPNSMDCIRCGKCIQNCPTSALHTSFTKSGRIRLQNIEAEAITDTTNTMSTTDQGAGHVEETAKTGKSSLKEMTLWSRIRVYLAALICIWISVSLFDANVSDLRFISHGIVQSPMDFIRYCFSQLLFLIPITMTFLFGIGIIVFGRKDHAMAGITSWPGQLIRLTLLCVVISYLSLFVYVAMAGVEISVDLFTLPVMINAVTFALIGVLFGAQLVIWLLFWKIR